MKQEPCGLCCSERAEVKILLAFLRRKILKQSQEYVPDYKEEEADRDQSDGFSRLLILIFGHTATNHSTFRLCPHLKFSRYFRRKLKCDSLTFNSLCSELAGKLAERNYQLQVLNLQIGSIANTAMKEADNPMADAVAKRAQERKSNQQIMSVPSFTNPQSQTLLQQPEQRHFQSIPTYWMPQPHIMGFPWIFGNPPERN